MTRPASPKLNSPSRPGDLGRHLHQAAGDPALDQRRVGAGYGRFEGAQPLGVGRARHDQAADVPQLVHEVTPSVEDVRRQREVVARRDTNRHRQPQRIRAVLRDQLERILDVALGLAHLHAALGADEAVQVHGVERQLLGELQART